MNFETMMNLFSRRGILFPSSEIYDSAPAGFWEYGPYGASIKRKLENLWRNEIVKKTGMIEIDGSICMPSDVFRASGHLENFADPLVECNKCASIFRADKLIQERTKENVPEGMQPGKFDELIERNKVKCPNCKGDFGKTRRFNMMFGVKVGASNPQDAYLRPETCQAIFADFPRLIKVMKKNLPLGIAQVGRSFRNEISPRNAVLRAREFTQAEAEVFFDPSKSDDDMINFNLVKGYELNLQHIGEKKDYVTVKVEDAVKRGWISKFAAFYLSIMEQFLLQAGIPKDKIRNRKLGDDEKAFYAKESWDTEVKTSLGWVEIVANNNRSDFDMKSHGKISGKSVEVVNSETNEKFIPHIWEMSMGIDRLFYVVAELSYKKDGDRVFLSLPYKVAPYDVCVFPLINKNGLPEIAKQIVDELKLAGFDVDMETKDSIGKRYARADEIGVPFCITVDSETISDKSVTIRERNTKKQQRYKVKEIADNLKEIENSL